MNEAHRAFLELRETGETEVKGDDLANQEKTDNQAPKVLQVFRVHRALQHRRENEVTLAPGETLAVLDLQESEEHQAVWDPAAFPDYLVHRDLLGQRVT